MRSEDSGATPAANEAVDELFRDPPFGRSEFRFDASVARVFSDMLRRSIPGYAALLSILSVVARRHAVSGTTLYDLGCSLGAATLTMRHALTDRDVRIVAVDNSEAMLERFRSALEDDPASIPVEALLSDVRDLDFDRASLIVLNFTLQFLPVEDRGPFLRRCHAALIPGGALLLSEKIEEPGGGRWLADLHDEFREANGYTRLEIARKRAALERVLVTESEAAHVERLRGLGFEVTRVFSALNFVSLLAVRSGG